MSDNGIGQDTARFGSFRSRAATHAGTANRLNEDAYVNRPDLGLWAVADGAGGHESGEVASAEVASLLQSIDAGLSAAEMLVEVRTRLEAAHARLHAEASRHGAGVMVATTVVVLLARDDHFACLWAGNSRAYLLRDRTLTRITRDHSLVQALVESGTISEAEAAHHPQANVITRAVGADSDLLELEKRTGQLLAGDRLLLCSDGLCKTLSEEQLAELLSGDDDTGAERLVMAALTAQVTDNVTVVTIGFDAGEETVSMEAERRRACRDRAGGQGTSGGSRAGPRLTIAAVSRSSADQDRGTAHDDGAAMGAHAAQLSRRHAADQHREGAQGDHVGRPDADRHVADTGRRHAADQGRDAAGRQDRAADMRHQDGDHRADMHVAHARSRHAHQSVSASMRPTPPAAMSLAETRKWRSLVSRRAAGPRAAARATAPATASPVKCGCGGTFGASGGAIESPLQKAATTAQASGLSNPAVSACFIAVRRCSSVGRRTHSSAASRS